MLRQTTIAGFLLMSGLGYAANPALQKQVDRHDRYFSRAAAVVKAGAVAPYGTRRLVGVGAQYFAGIDAAVGTQEVVERGMSQRYLVGTVRPSLGFALGAGPTYMQKRVAAKPGGTAKDVLPQNGSVDVIAHAFVASTRISNPLELKMKDVDFSFNPIRAGGDIGVTFAASKKIGAPKPSAMLQKLEEGAALAKAAQADLASGETVGMQSKVARMKELRALVRKEKRQIDRQR